MTGKLEQIILTDAERQQMVAEGYRIIRLLSDGTLQVAREVTPVEIYGELKNGTPGRFTMLWDWVNWPRKGNGAQEADGDRKPIRTPESTEEIAGLKREIVKLRKLIKPLSVRADFENNRWQFGPG